MTPMTPSGVRTRSMWRPFGRSHSAITSPTGSFRAAIARMPSAIARMRSGVSFRRSISASESPASAPLPMSSALASRIAVSRASIASAIARRAASLTSPAAVASGLDAARASRPIRAISAATSVSVFFCRSSIGYPFALPAEGDAAAAVRDMTRSSRWIIAERASYPSAAEMASLFSPAIFTASEAS